MLSNLKLFPTHFKGIHELLKPIFLSGLCYTCPPEPGTLLSPLSVFPPLSYIPHTMALKVILGIPTWLGK